jgi:hypothetical protein
LQCLGDMPWVSRATACGPTLAMWRASMAMSIRPIHFWRHSPRCQCCLADGRSGRLVGLRSAGAVFYSFHPGTSRLPVRRFPSKICAALALQRRLRLDVTDHFFISLDFAARFAACAGSRRGDRDRSRAALPLDAFRTLLSCPVAKSRASFVARPFRDEPPADDERRINTARWNNRRHKPVSPLPSDEPLKVEGRKEHAPTRR